MHHSAFTKSIKKHKTGVKSEDGKENAGIHWEKDILGGGYTGIRWEMSRNAGNGTPKKASSFSLIATEEAHKLGMACWTPIGCEGKITGTGEVVQRSPNDGCVRVRDSSH